MLPTTPVTSSISAPASFVNTSLPGSIAIRPPPGTVAPSVANAQLYNNAGGGGAVVAPRASAPSIYIPIIQGGTGLPASFSGDGGSGFGSSGFLAQLIGQGGGAPALLAVYEEMVQNAQVRYMPSRATEPPPAPVGVYGRFLQEAKAAQAPVNIAPPQPAVTQPAPAPVAAQLAALPAATTLVSRSAPASTPVDEQPVAAAEEAPEAPSFFFNSGGISVPKASLAYLASIARNLAPNYSQPIESA